MHKLTLVLDKTYQSLKYIIPAALLLGVFQMPVFPNPDNSASKLLTSTFVPSHVVAGEITSNQAIAMTEEFFGEVASAPATQGVIEKQVAFVSSRNAYPASLSVVQKHEKTIKSKAAQYNVPEDVAIGVALLENGGSDTAKSPAGALGVFQLMPGTARGLGLTVNKNTDDRRDPLKNIDAGVRYLKGNYETFGDWGLATWAYHAGEGNVSKALKLYAKSNHGVTLKGMKDQSAMRAYIEKHGITIHKLLSDPAVKQFTKKLNDDSSGYPFKVVATAKLFKEAVKSKEVVTR